MYKNRCTVCNNIPFEMNGLRIIKCVKCNKVTHINVINKLDICANCAIEHNICSVCGEPIK